MPKTPMPLVSKKEFIEQWLMTQCNDFHCESISDDSSLSLTTNSVKSKRILTSPFRNLKEIKHFKSINEKDESSNLLKRQIGISYPLQSTENLLFYKNNADTVQRCRATVHSSPETAMRPQIPVTFANKVESVNHQSFESCRIHNQRTVHQINKDIKTDSADITDIESPAPSSSVFDDIIEFESSKNVAIDSPLSSPRDTNSHSGLSNIIHLDQDLAMIDNENQTMGVVANDVNLNLSISILNSESDTASILSEEYKTISSINSSDSDQTFFTQNKLLNNTIIKHDKTLELSSIITEDCESLQNSNTGTDSIDRGIGLENSQVLRSSKLENLDNYPIILNGLIKKKQKLKKGSLVGQLQTLITGQTSFFRIWQHQLAEINSRIQNKQCIILKITHCTWKYNRQCLFGLVISDIHNLLDKIFQKFPESNRVNKNSSALSEKFITVLTTPEIVGIININETSTLKIYPPWEVVDAKKYVLSVSYFHNIIHNFNSTGNNTKVNNKIIKKFDCSCLIANQLVKSCTTRFTDNKPSSSIYLFED